MLEGAPVTAPADQSHSEGLHFFAPATDIRHSRRIDIGIHTNIHEVYMKYTVHEVYMKYT